MITWNEKNEPIISKYVAKFLEILEVDGRGKVSTTRGFELNVCLKILSTHIEIDGVSSSRDTAYLLHRAFFNRLKLYRRQNLNYLKLALSTAAKRFLRRPLEQ